MAAGLTAVAEDLAALVEEELDVRARRVACDELELVPQRLQLFLSLFVQQQFAQRRVVARVAHHVVEARAQQPALVFRVVGIEASALANVERIRKDGAESRKRLLIAG